MKAITLKALRERETAQVPLRFGVRIVAVFVLLQALLLAALMIMFSSSAGAAPVKGDIAVNTAGGYARMVFTLAEETEAEVRLANGIVIIAFKQAVDVPVDRIPMFAPGYVNAARRDPDGSAVRLALNRKVTVNTMAAGEKLFVDLLPEGWSGLPPGLPQEVVEDLARRAREAEKKARAQQRATRQRTLPPVRVRVGTQPTFTRYTFGLPALIAVASERNDDSKMTLTFEAPLRFDLSDVQATLPPVVAAVEAKSGEETAVLTFEFIGKVDVRTFREDNNYILDIQALKPRAGEGEKLFDLAGAAALAEKRVPPPVAATTEKPAAPAAEKPAAPAVEKPAAPPAAAKPVEAKPMEVAAPAAEKPAAPASTVDAKTVPVRAEPAEPKPAEPKPAPSTTGLAGANALAAREGALPAREGALPARENTPRTAEEARSASDLPAPVVVEVRRQGDAVRLTFPFAEPTPAAMFRRGDTISLVFDSQAPIDIGKIAAQSGRSIRNATVTRSGDGQMVQFKVEQPKLTSAGADGSTWTVVIGDMILEPTQQLSATRATNAGRASIAIPFQEPRQVHRLVDADVGDTLVVITALGPARGFLRPQEFVEFNTLVSTHGVVLQPLADDVVVETAPDKIVIGRPAGLTLSIAAPRPPADMLRGASRNAAATLDPQAWGFDREADFRDRQTHLVAAAAAASEAQRTLAQLELARFYLARELTAEAKGVLDVAASEERAKDDSTPLMLRAIANVMLGRGADAMKDLTSPAVAKRGDVALWRALAQAQQGKWVEAREGFRSLETTAATLPLQLQRLAFQEAARAAIEVRDFGGAATLINEFDTLGPAPEGEAELAVLKGRVMEGLGRLADALALYHGAAETPQRPAAARARLREIALRQSVGDIKREDATAALETLSMSWRGDETEAEALQLLGRLYAQDGRYRDAFQVMRSALTSYPRSEMTRRIQDEAAVAFDSLFLGGKGDSLPAIDALSLFYDFRELTPVGRRGDEMIRKLADRLVAVDLLDQAAELLQHQVDNRLQGAARAQVAVRLSVIYLMAHKPDRAVAVLRTTRSGDLPNELRNQRLLIEARAQSDVGRPDVALEVIGNIDGPESERLRADIMWKARRWREASEQMEKMLGDRWRDFAPLTEPERSDVMRAAIGYALGEDMIGLDRFRTKYVPKMAEGPDRRAFEVVTAPSNTNAPEFGDIARLVAATDTLEAFLRDIRARFPETTGPEPGSPAAQPAAPAVPSRGASAGIDKAG